MAEEQLPQRKRRSLCAGLDPQRFPEVPPIPGASTARSVVAEVPCVTAVPVRARVVSRATVASSVLGSRDLDASHAGADDFGSDNRAVLGHRGQGVHSGRDDPLYGQQRSRARRGLGDDLLPGDLGHPCPLGPPLPAGVKPVAQPDRAGQAGQGRLGGVGLGPGGLWAGVLRPGGWRPAAGGPADCVTVSSRDRAAATRDASVTS